MKDGYCIRAKDGIWRLKCPKCGFLFARTDEEMSNVDCPRCHVRLNVGGAFR